MQWYSLPSPANNHMDNPVPNLFPPDRRTIPLARLACLKDRPRPGHGLILTRQLPLVTI